MQCVVHVLQRDVHALGFRAVHFDEQLRHFHGEGREDALHPGKLAAVDHHIEGGARERVKPNILFVLHHHFKSADVPKSAHRRGWENQHQSIAQLVETAVKLAHD